MSVIYDKKKAEVFNHLILKHNKDRYNVQGETGLGEIFVLKCFHETNRKLFFVFCCNH